MKSRISLGMAFALTITASNGALALEDDGDVLDTSIQMGCEARNAITERVDQFWDDAEDVLCNEVLDMENRWEESPHVWVSEDALCNNNYSMPGLPGISGLGQSSCEQLEAVTGRTIEDANRVFQGALDEALTTVGQEPGAVDVNLDELARDVISNQR